MTVKAQTQLLGPPAPLRNSIEEVKAPRRIALGSLRLTELFDEQATLMKFLCISLIIVGVVGLKLNSNRQDASIEHQEKIEEAAEDDIGSASIDDLEPAVDEHVAHCVS